MPRQNTSPSDFPAAIRQQITLLAQRIAAERKRRCATQVQWAEQLGISQPTMARLERGDPAVSMATYVACLMLIEPALDLMRLLPQAANPSAIATESIAITTGIPSVTAGKTSADPQAVTSSLTAEQQAQVAQQFAAAKAALEGFKSPGF